MAKISELKFDDKNFNEHTEFGMSLLEKSLRELGAGRSILIDKNNNIIAGNGIVEAAAQAGIEDIKIIETDGSELIAVKRTNMELDTEDGRRMAMADNATASVNLSWDENMLRDSFNDEELSGWGVHLSPEIDWAKVQELDNENYDAPEHEMYRCPKCGHVDRKAHFIKVSEK